VDIKSDLFFYMLFSVFVEKYISTTASQHLDPITELFSLKLYIIFRKLIFTWT
jgi:hypothetical protein